MSRPPECLAPNSDVSGIGLALLFSQLQISFYVNTIFIAAVSRMEPFNELLEPLETNSGLNRLALLITAAAQSASAISGSLSLYHAIIALDMLTLLLVRRLFMMKLMKMHRGMGIIASPAI